MKNYKRGKARFAGRKLFCILTAGLLTLSVEAQAANIAVFGNNSIQTFLNANGHTATVVNDGQLATPGFLDPFDLFIYTRDGASGGTTLSVAAATNVSNFVTGNVALFTSDLADNGFPGDATDTLMLNAVAFTDQKGYIGEYTGSCAAMSSNNQGLQPLSLIAGDCGGLSSGFGGDPMDILQNGHPLVAGVPDPVNLGDSHGHFALVMADPQFVIAVNSNQIPSIVATEGVPPGPRATFFVSKSFDDGNTAEVEVTISCNTGLPLEQSTTISEGDPVNFVVVDFNDGEMNCTVTETGGVEGYSVNYFDGFSDSDEGCTFEDIPFGGRFSCVIENSLEQVEVEVTKVWIDENPQFAAQNVADADWECSNVAFGQDDGFLQFFGNPGSDSFFVFPDWESGTTCSITEVALNESGVEVDDSDCQGLLVLPGEGASCTIFNTRLFEGIPTLSQYGLAVLALLMLGVGFIAFRRFV